MQLQCVPRDLADGDLYQPLPADHYCISLALDTMNLVAEQIERLVNDDEPYEINVLGLKTTEMNILPVLTIGITRPDRLETVLPSLGIPFKVHLSESYPAAFSNNVDRCSRPHMYSSIQHDVPLAGSSCGLLTNDRHSSSLGAYVQLSSAPKKVFILTIPLGSRRADDLPKGSIVTQPSVADREQSYELEDKHWKEVLQWDIQQAAALSSRRQQLERTFQFAVVAGTSFDATPAEARSLFYPSRVLFERVFDGQPMRSQVATKRDLSQPSSDWAVLELTRDTTISAIMSMNKGKFWFLPFRSGLPKQSPIHPLLPGFIVSKTGRTTGRTIGTVNGIKSIYRLPRDGKGVRRYDYAVLSHPWGGAFAYPGDAGAVVMAQEKSDIVDSNQTVHPGKPCGILVGASTSGHVAFVQDMEIVTAGIKAAGLGNVSFFHLGGM